VLIRQDLDLIKNLIACVQGESYFNKYIFFLKIYSNQTHCHYHFSCFAYLSPLEGCYISPVLKNTRSFHLALLPVACKGHTGQRFEYISATLFVYYVAYIYSVHT
jgi:hypothetical protein